MFPVPDAAVVKPLQTSHAANQMAPPKGVSSPNPCKNQVNYELFVKDVSWGV